MAWQTWVGRTDQLPVILAGPILRRTLPEEVTVWVALRTACTVRLDVTGGGQTLTGTADTIRLGSRLHVAAVTALGATLARNQVYTYNLTLSGGATGNLLTAGILSSGGVGPSSVGPGGSGLPSFSLPPADLNQLRIVHASCRKVHGGGTDPTSALDAVIAATASNPLTRPHMLFFTGDQIYADDVADRMLVMIMDAAEALGFNPENPILPPGISVLPTAGLRNDLMKKIGVTSSSALLSTNVAKSHLILFAEFACMYLFSWSEVLWQGDDLPTPQQTYDTFPATRADTSVFEPEGVSMRSFRQSISAVRRVLANIPTYMMFDDHEVSDDWFLDRQWVNKSVADPLFGRLVQNALAAYAAFQGWGNNPIELETVKGGKTLLDALETWANAPNVPANSTDLVGRLGLPTASPPAGQAYARNANAVSWHYSYVDPALPFKVAVLDTRTRRQYGSKAHGAPGLIAPSELASQLGSINASSTNEEELILLISPSPVAGYPLVESALKYAASVAAYFPDPEFWQRHRTSYHRMLAAVVAPHAGARRRIVALSGDVHYAFTSRLQYHATTPIDRSSPAAADGVVVQLTSSSQKNEEGKTIGLHHANLNASPAKTFGWNNAGGGLRVIGTTDNGGDPLTIGKVGSPIIFEAPGDFSEVSPDWSTDPQSQGSCRLS